MVFTQKINEVEWKQWQSYNNPPQLFYERIFSFNLLITNRHLWQQEPSVRVVEQLATTSYKTCWDWLQKNLLFALVPTKMLTVANWMVVSPYPTLPSEFVLFRGKGSIVRNYKAMECLKSFVRGCSWAAGPLTRSVYHGFNQKYADWRYPSFFPVTIWSNESKRPRQSHLGKQRVRRLKSEFAFSQSLSRLFLLTYFVKCTRTLRIWIPRDHT